MTEVFTAHQSAMQSGRPNYAKRSAESQAAFFLPHLGDPLAALVEARRVARPGAVIGLVDADWDGQLLYPNNPLLDRSLELMILLRQGISPYVGKQLRSLLVEAGFVRCEGLARVMNYGTPDEVAGVGTFTAGVLTRPSTVEVAVAQGWATAGELEEMAAAWREWSEMPGAFLARFWCEALGWASV